MRDRPSPVSAAKCSLLRLLLLAREERNILNCFFFLHFLGLENLIKFSLTCGPIRNLVRHVMEDQIECVVRAA
jgi:hypothetical protein